jgi:hypothetical protein
MLSNKINKIGKPTNKNSRYGFYFQRAARWCDCSIEAILNGLMRVGRKADFKLSNA